jgi:hypothetical protein
VISLFNADHVLIALPDDFENTPNDFAFLRRVMMKRIVLALLVLAVAGSAWAQAVNVPTDGLTGLWRFQTADDKLKATIGADLTSSRPENPNWGLGPWTMIGVPGNAGKYADGGAVQDMSWDYMSCYHGISGGNGGGTYINEYTIAIDVMAGGGKTSLYQTAWGGNSNDGDLWIDNTTPSAALIGVDPIGWSEPFNNSAVNQSPWRRVVLSVDNGATGFFRAYVDGTLVLDKPGQAIDGRFSLELDRFNLFADDNWQDAWCWAGTVAVWDHALTTEQIVPMGGWIGGAATPTELVVPEPSTFVLLAAGLAIVFVLRRKK